MAAAETSKADKRKAQKINPMRSSLRALRNAQDTAPVWPKSVDPGGDHDVNSKKDDEKSNIDPMHSSKPHWSKGLMAFAAAIRCGAKRRAGGACQSPAMENGRCRMHGGASPGAPLGNRNALKHGQTTAAALTGNRLLRDVKRHTAAVIAAANASATETRLKRLALAALLRTRAPAIHSGTVKTAQEPDA